LLTAALHLFAMLASNVASTLRMCFRRGPVIGTQATSQALPEAKTDTQQQETTDRRAPARQSTRSVENDDRTIIIIAAKPMESFSGLSRESRLAQHRDCQLTVPLIPAKAGTQGRTRGPFRSEASIPYKTHNRSWIPAFAGTSGDRAVYNPRSHYPGNRTPAFT